MKTIFDETTQGVEVEPVLEQHNQRNCESCLKEKANGVVHLYQENTIWVCPRRFHCNRVKGFKDRYVNTLYRRSQIPNELLKKTGKDFQVTQKWQSMALKTVSNWVHKCKESLESESEYGTRIALQSVNWLALFGQQGSGKTHLAVSAAKFAMGEGVEVFFVRWANVMSELKGNWNFDTPMYNRCLHVPVLFLDDLYKGNITEFELKATAELIDYRYANNLPTIITSEKLPSEIIDLDEATAGRIFERCKNGWFEIPRNRANDYRMAGVLIANA